MEIVLFTKKHIAAALSFPVGEDMLQHKITVKYLGMMLNTKHGHAGHVSMFDAYILVPDPMCS